MNHFTFEKVQGFVDSTVTGVFRTMMQLEVQPQEPVPLSLLSESRVVSSVSFTGEKINGVVCLHISESYAVELTAALLGMPCPEVSGHEMVNDAMGELANVVTGNIKSKFSDEGYPCLLSIPSIFRGNKIEVESTRHSHLHHFAYGDGSNTVLVELFLKS
ncbi:MAG: chemotaxis protein CheX [Verrucomicrobiae bacterium]|nr:chemotaxis protein CheX [Verrucomicrobiae bacterium]